MERHLDHVNDPHASGPRLSVPSGSRMPFGVQVMRSWRRALTVNLRVPVSVVIPLVISLFFLFIYQGQLGKAASSFLQGSYLGFILPLSVISAAFSGAGLAGQTLVRDLETGYFDKLLLTPINRWALLLGPMLAAASVLVVQTVLLVGVALLMGLHPATGALGLLALLGYTLLVGLGFGGFTVGVALMSGNAAATESATFLFFPLSFLTATFVPLKLLEGWLGVAARLNPITYILEASRSLINTGWQAHALFAGALASGGMFVALFGFAVVALRTRTQRR